MIRCRVLLLMLVLTQAAGCAWIPGVSGFGPFGDPEAAQLLLARGEAGDLEAGFGEVQDYWRQRLCETEQAAKAGLRRQVAEEVEAAWALARLGEGGKELPALTDARRSRILGEVMDEARLVGRSRPRSGQFESFYGVRLSGDFPACLEATGSGRECARPPVMAPVASCNNLTPAPEPLYFLEGA